MEEIMSTNTNFLVSEELGKYPGKIKPKNQNAVLPAKRATQHFGFWVQLRSPTYLNNMSILIRR